MDAEFDIQLPSVFPQRDIKVTDESHFYETTLGDNQAVIEKTEYVLDKAPVYSIVDVTGTAGETTVEFEQGVDYKLSTDDNRIVWLSDPATRPDAGTRFFVTYRCGSILSRYIGSVEAEFDTTDTEIENVISAKFVDQASGEELDQLGQLFGVIGQRNGRDDPKYRNYLKAVVQAFSSRGKRSDIKEAIAASLSGVTEETRISTDDVEIAEDFENTEYDIVLHDWTPHRISTLYEIAEIVDPSGVHQSDLQYVLPQQESQTADEVVTTDGFQVVDEAQAAIVDVILNIGIDETTDTSLSSDSITEDIHIRAATPKSWDTSSWDSFDWDGKSTSELIGAADTIGSAVKLDAGTDISSSADAASATATTVIWDGGNYDQMNWN